MKRTVPARSAAAGGCYRRLLEPAWPAQVHGLRERGTPLQPAAQLLGHLAVRFATASAC
jgi:hypothetical protein